MKTHRIHRAYRTCAAYLSDHQLHEIDPTAMLLHDGHESYLLLAPPHVVRKACKADVATAVHEAGHVVVADDLGIAVDYVSIILNKQRGLAGCAITRCEHAVVYCAANTRTRERQPAAHDPS